MKTDLALTEQPATRTAKFTSTSSVKRLETAADIPLYMLSFGLLSLSVFSVPRLATHRMLIFAGLAAACLYLSLAPGRTREHARRKGMGLFTVILIDVYFITFTRYEHQALLLGTTPRALASLLILLASVLWLFRLALLRSWPSEAPAQDVAVIALAMVNLIGYVKASALHARYGTALEPQAHLTWVVVVSALLYYMLRDLGRSKITTVDVARGAPITLLVSCCAAAVWPWL
jgi:hypothetical protein